MAANQLIWRENVVEPREEGTLSNLEEFFSSGVTGDEISHQRNFYNPIPDPFLLQKDRDLGKFLKLLFYLIIVYLCCIDMVPVLIQGPGGSQKISFNVYHEGFEF